MRERSNETPAAGGEPAELQVLRRQLDELLREVRATVAYPAQSDDLRRAIARSAALIAAGGERA